PDKRAHVAAVRGPHPLKCSQLFRVSGDRRKQGDVKGHLMARLRTSRSWLAAGMVMIAMVGVACSSSHPAAPPKVIFDKGTPFADLLVPKLTASVTDGAVGGTVDAPVTVSVADGVLGAVTMVNENGRTVNGQLSPDGLRWSTTDQLGYNRRYTLTAKALGLGGAANRQMTFQTSSPAHLTMPY